MSDTSEDRNQDKERKVVKPSSETDGAIASRGKDTNKHKNNKKKYGHKASPAERPKNKKEDVTASEERSDERDEKYAAVGILLLYFELNDLGCSNNQRIKCKRVDTKIEHWESCLGGQIEQVKEAFEQWGFHDPQTFAIPQDDSQEQLERRVKAFLSEDKKVECPLRVVYYAGHGDFNKKKGLELSSHNYPVKPWATIHKIVDYLKVLQTAKDLNDVKPQLGSILDSIPCVQANELDLVRKLMSLSPLSNPPADIKWGPIKDRIVNAKCDALVILDCCEAGGAALTLRNLSEMTGAGNHKKKGKKDPHRERHRYAKELIAASSWNTETKSLMTPALCSAMGEAFKDENSRGISTLNLVRDMNENLVQKDASQAIHDRFQLVKGGRFIRLWRPEHIGRL